MNNQIHHFMKPLIAINISIIVAGSFLIPLWGDFVKAIGGDVRTAGTAIFIFSIALGVVMWFAAKLEQMLKNEEIILFITAVLTSACYFGYLFVHHPWQLYIIQVFLGLSAAFQCPAIFSLYTRHMPKELSTFHWGIWNGFYNISVGVAALASAFIAHRWGFKAVFISLFTVSLIAVFLSLAIIPKIKQFESYRLLTEE